METLFIDTHILVWLQQGKTSSANLSKKAIRAINQADLILVSPMVIFEVQLLIEIGRLKKQDPWKLVSHLSSRLPIEIAKESFSNIIHRALDIAYTRDPFDRLIIAHASLKNCPLVTHDESIQKIYEKSLW